MTEEVLQKVLENPDKVFFPGLGNDNIFSNGISIKRELLTIPGTDFTIYKYGFIIALGLFLALIYAYKNFKKFGINPDKATNAIIGGVIGGIIGARLYYVAFKFDSYVDDGKIQWADIFRIRDGGLAIYGGIIGALLIGGIIAHINKIRLSALLDVAAVGFFIGQGLGRWGNFFNQEAYGAVTDMPWGMTSKSIIQEIRIDSPDIAITDITVHPCFFYEFLLCLVGVIGLLIYKKHRKFDGEMFLMYVAWYGLGRAIIEGLRTDSLYIGNSSIRVSQLLSVVICFVAVVTIIVVRIKLKHGMEYKFFYETEYSKESLRQYDEQVSKLKAKKQKVPKDVSKAIDNAFNEDNDQISEELDNKEEKIQCFESENSEDADDDDTEQDDDDTEQDDDDDMEDDDE